MDFGGLEVLEDKIIQALNTIDSLKDENNQLYQELDKVNAEFQACTLEKERLHEELNQLNEKSNVKDQAIRQKVSDLLGRLEKL